MERGLLLARSGYAEHAGEAVLTLLEQGECPLALLDALAPPDLEAFEVETLGERFERPRLGELAFGPRAERVFCVQDRVQVVELELGSGSWRELARAPQRIRSLACDREPILTYDAGGQPVVRIDGGQLVTLPGPKAHGGRDLVAGLLPGAYLVRGTRSLKAYALVGKKRAIWSLTSDFGEDAVGVGPGGAVASRDERLLFHELGARKPSHEVHLEPILPEAARFGLSPYAPLAVQRAGAGAQVLYALEEQDHAHGLAWVAPDGRVEGKVELPFGAWRWAASPCGRYSLLLAQERGRAGPSHFRTRQVFLVDLERSAVRELALPALPGGLAWSRTGRSFAISTEEGTLVLGRTDPALKDPSPGQAPQETSQEDSTWRELYKAQRFWRARQQGARVELHYGARGGAGVQRSKEFASSELAAKDLARRVREKEREGYSEG